MENKDNYDFGKDNTNWKGGKLLDTHYVAKLIKDFREKGVEKNFGREDDFKGNSREGFGKQDFGKGFRREDYFKGNSGD